jgi:hypothetical protein
MEMSIVLFKMMLMFMMNDINDAVKSNANIYDDDDDDDDDDDIKYTHL